MLKTEFCMPFSELATHDVKLSQEFKGKLKNGREICITRGDWECAPCPICTMVLSDETMNTILNRVIAELNTYEFQAETAHRKDDDDDYDSDSVKSLVTSVLADFGVMYYVAGLNYVRTESSYADIDLALEY